MKKILLYTLLVLSTSCHTAHYTHDLYSTSYGIDYRKGKWVINDVSAPETIKEKLTDIAYDFFYDELGPQLKKPEDITTYSLPYVPIDPDTLRLEQFKTATNFDYLINIKSETTKDDIGPLKIGDTYRKEKKIAYTILQIYDLNTFETIYSRKVTGEITITEDDNKDFAFVKSSYSMMVKCLKKILKKIEKTSL